MQLNGRSLSVLTGSVKTGGPPRPMNGPFMFVDGSRSARPLARLAPMSRTDRSGRWMMLLVYSIMLLWLGGVGRSEAFGLLRGMCR
jgi:hypothetical protein